MKKLISMLTTIVFAIGMMGAFPTVAAAGVYYVSGDYEYRFLEDGTASIISYTGYDEVVEIPSEFDGVTVTMIDVRGFYGCDFLTDVTIPNTVKEITDGAFNGCSSLTDITIPSSVTEIDIGAFENCTSLTEINVSENNQEYASVDGVLFDEDLTELIICPIGKSGVYTIPAGVESIGEESFGECALLTDIVIPNSVTEIDEYAFMRCDLLTKITIPDSVTEIGESAFFYCDSLTEAIIPSSVIEIGWNVFIGCWSMKEIKVSENNQYYASVDGALFSKDLTEIVSVLESTIGSYIIPDSVTRIDDYAFDGCSRLTDITIPNSVISIGEYAFTGCDLLTEITIPNSVEYIGRSAFFDSFELEKVTIPESVVLIGDYAFNYCESLTEINVSENNQYYTSTDGVLFDKDLTELIVCPAGKSGVYAIPAGVTSIYKSAFESCDFLTDITIPNSVTSIGYYAFCDSEKLTKVTIPSSVTEIGSNAFLSCRNVTVYGYTGSYAETYAEENDIPFAEIEGGIAEPTEPTEPTGDFIYNISDDGTAEITDYEGTATDIEIPAEIDGYTVNSIASRTFNQKVVTSVIIPETVTTIGEYAFYNCYRLTSVDVPASVTEIGAMAFCDSDNLTDINVSENNPNYASIDGVLFNKDLSNLIQYPAGKTETEFIVPESVTSITNAAFDGSENLTSIIFSENVASIGDNLFRNCSNLTSILVDENNQSFTSVDGVLFNKDITEILRFPAGKEVSSYTVPDTVTVIGIFAFQQTDITEVILPDGITLIKQGAFYSCTDLASITLPSLLEKIGIDAFFYCKSLSSVIIPDGVTEIEQMAFSYAHGLQYAEIPESVTFIGKNAFIDCDDLTICGKVGSYAETYAKKAEIPFVEIEGGTTDPGDKPTTPPEDFDYEISEDGPAEIIGYTGSETDLVIPGEIDGYEVTEIGDYAFLDYTSLTSAVIPDSVTEIGSYAFAGCTSLTKIIIPSNVTYISKPTEVTYTDGSIGFKFGSFIGCDNLTIYGYIGSYAETYAEENKIPFADLDVGIIDPPEPTPGDLDGNGEISIVDVVAVAKIVHNQISDITEETFAAADINYDNKINAIDLSIVKYLLLQK
ncbi:MAG: leucine-rich repeat protein [Ruminococcus sp.]|nr:leucine-rich repeat protein [Ruminococcus sp.]